MSRSIGLFVDFQGSIAELATVMSDITGLSFVEQPPETAWVVRDESFCAVLAESPESDSGNSALARYRYTLSAEVPDEVRPADAAETIMMRLIADQMRHQQTAEVLLVLDLQFRGRSSVPAGGLPADGADPSRSDEP